MTFLNPAGLIFAGLIPIIILLYLLKLRRQPAQVSTLMFWQRVVADNRRRALFQRLRQLLSLLLSLLIFALLLLALARPELRVFRGTESGLTTMVILDCRARMQTLNGHGSTRFAEARRIAESYLRRASNRQPVALLAMNNAPRVVCGTTGDERVLLDALAGLRATDTGGRIEDAVQLAHELLRATHGAGRVVLVTDEAPAAGTGATVAAVPLGETETRLVDTGGARENVGIVRLDARPLPGSPETDEVFVEIENFGASRQSGNVELSFEGRILDVKPFDLAPGELRSDVYPALAARTGIANARGWLSAHLALTQGSGGDALALDDDAYAVVPPPRPIRVLLVTPGNYFLENLLKADDGVQFDQLAPDAFQPAQAAGFDSVILDDCLPAGFQSSPGQLPQGNFLFIGNSPLPDAAGKTETVLEHPLVTDVDANSPLLRRVNLRDITILRAQSWSLPDSSAAVGMGSPAQAGNAWEFHAPVRSFDHPLVLTGERQAAAGTARHTRLAAVAFGVADSDLPLRVAFPLFIHNALDWLAARDESATKNEPVQAGEIIEVPAGVRLWSRAQRSYQPVGEIAAGDWIVGPGTFQPLSNGFYLLREQGAPDRWVAVDTLDRAMSAVNGADIAELPAAREQSLATAAAASSDWWEVLRVWPPWMELALLAFVLCTLEWWSFHRRRTE